MEEARLEAAEESAAVLLERRALAVKPSGWRGLRGLRSLFSSGPAATDGESGQAVKAHGGWRALRGLRGMFSAPETRDQDGDQPVGDEPVARGRSRWRNVRVGVKLGSKDQ